ncbi:MAG: LysM peptidoglycan-binding domain-containing protein [Caldilineaceae bacterium]
MQTLSQLRNTFAWADRLLLVSSLAMLTVSMFIVGCGQVITLTPTPTPAPTPTIGVTLAANLAPATSTPAPYTPAPTLTPTMTPTPVIHTVQSGESLLAIATQYGISVSALQDANGILDPRTLQVGQQLIIPRPDETDEASAPTATPTPLPLPVQNVYLNETATGNVWLLGEVKNDTDTALEQVQVAAVLLDAQGRETARAETLVALDLVEPGDLAPFALLFDNQPTQYDRYQITVKHAVPAYVGSYYRDLEVNRLESARERYSSYTVSGAILNRGPEEAVSVQVVLVAYDSLERVVAMRKVDPDYNVVPRGGEASFTAILTPLGGPVSRIEAIAQGRRLQTTTP